MNKFSLLFLLVLLLIPPIQANVEFCSSAYVEGRLAPYYELQMNETSCSLASSTPIFNILLAKQNQGTHQFVRQKQMIDRLKNPAWKKAIADDGDGIVLEQLQDYFNQGLKEFKIAGYHAKAVYFSKRSEENIKKLQEILTKFQNENDTFVILNFRQKDYTQLPDDTSGHYSPIGSYDIKNKKVLVLDTYPGRGNYWIDLDTALKGMATFDSDSQKYRGLLMITKKKN